MKKLNKGFRISRYWRQLTVWRFDGSGYLISTRKVTPDRGLSRMEKSGVIRAALIEEGFSAVVANVSWPR